MEIDKIIEHEDGSATLHIDFTQEEHDALLRYGIITALNAGIEEANKWEDKYED